MSNKVVRTHKNEFRRSNLGFDHDPVDAFVRSQWQTRSKSYVYLVYRWLMAIFTTFVVIYALVKHVGYGFSVGTFFIYLTYWGIMINMVTGIFGAILVTIWHFHGEFRVTIEQTTDMPLSFKIFWAIHNTALINAFIVTIIYWTSLHNGSLAVNAVNILMHVTNSAIMFVDILIVAHPLRLYHVIQPICFILFYGIVNFIYIQCGGRDITGKHTYIYPILDWAKPAQVAITVFGVIVLTIFVHFMLFLVYKLRVFVQRQFCGYDSTLPITASTRFGSSSLHTRF